MLKVIVAAFLVMAFFVISLTRYLFASNIPLDLQGDQIPGIENQVKTAVKNHGIHIEKGQRLVVNVQETWSNRFYETFPSFTDGKKIGSDKFANTLSIELTLNPCVASANVTAYNVIYQSGDVNPRYDQGTLKVAGEIVADEAAKRLKLEQNSSCHVQ